MTPEFLAVGVVWGAFFSLVIQVGFGYLSGALPLLEE
jgi:hypothetical protein